MPAFRLQIRVMPRASLLDPQGQAVTRALHALGFSAVEDVRIGKHLVMRLDAPTPEEATAHARSMCERLLANPVTEDFTVDVEVA